MAQPLRIEPDVQFIRELQAAGGESLKKCYQCATCSVACPISPVDNPYPRKEMIWAQWGLKDKLESDADVWLCHNCGNCSDLCPRGAKPADLMSALRNKAYQNLVPCASLSKWMSSPRYLPQLIAIPLIIFGIIWLIMAGINFGGWYPSGSGLIPVGDVVPGKVFYGDYTIDPVFILVTVFVVFSFYKGVKNLIAGIGPVGTTMMLGKKKNIIACLLEVIFLEILPHTKFTQCGDDEERKTRKLGHMCIIFGFASLAVVTGVFFLCHWGGRIPGLEAIYMEVPLSFTNPLKILAQVGMLLLLAGLTLVTVRRTKLDASKQTSNWYDWYLLIVIWAVAVTGALTQFFRLAEWAALTYFIYYLHLVTVFMLIAYLPWSKLGHLVYRTAAITYIRYMGRK